MLYTFLYVRRILQSDLLIIYDITLIPRRRLNDEDDNIPLLLFGDSLEGIMI